MKVYLYLYQFCLLFLKLSVLYYHTWNIFVWNNIFGVFFLIFSLSWLSHCVVHLTFVFCCQWKQKELTTEQQWCQPQPVQYGSKRPHQFDHDRCYMVKHFFSSFNNFFWCKEQYTELPINYNWNKSNIICTRQGGSQSSIHESYQNSGLHMSSATLKKDFVARKCLYLYFYVIKDVKSDGLICFGMTIN